MLFSEQKVVEAWITSFCGFCPVLISQFFNRYILAYWNSVIMNLEFIGYSSYYSLPLVVMTLTSSSWFVVVLAIDRFILIYLPHRAKSLMTIKRSYITVALIILFIVIFIVSFSTNWFVVDIDIDVCNGHWVIPNQTVYSDNTVYTPLFIQLPYVIYYAAFGILLQYLAPSIIIIVCNCFIISVLRNNRIANAATIGSRSKKRSSEIRLTKMIIAVNVLFLICNLPYNIFRILAGFVSESTIANLWIIANFFLMINVSSNIVIYSLFNAKLFGTISSFFGGFKCRNTCRSVKKVNQKVHVKVVVVSSLSSTCWTNNNYTFICISSLQYCIRPCIEFWVDCWASIVLKPIWLKPVYYERNYLYLFCPEFDPSSTWFFMCKLLYWCIIYCKVLQYI